MAGAGIRMASCMPLPCIFRVPGGCSSLLTSNCVEPHGNILEPQDLGGDIRGLELGRGSHPAH